MKDIKRLTYQPGLQPQPVALDFLKGWEDRLREEIGKQFVLPPHLQVSAAVVNQVLAGQKIMDALDRQLINLVCHGSAGLYVGCDPAGEGISIVEFRPAAAGETVKSATWNWVTDEG